MKISDYIVKFLKEMGTTDAFGVPGGVILDLLYAFDRNHNIDIHLTNHEQTAGFAACSYAQISGKLGVSYFTKGPGFTNIITSIAEAYTESAPVLFITAHNETQAKFNKRVESNQELDTVSMVLNITKYAKRIDSVEEFGNYFNKACKIAISDRKGPVFLDIYNKLFNEEIDEYDKKYVEKNKFESNVKIINYLESELQKAKRPLILIGDGIHQANFNFEAFNNAIDKLKIPVLSSRFANDVIPESMYYFGYIGSHGLRYSNYILSKADLIICLGNSLNFPNKSKSFQNIVNSKKFIAIDIDEKQFSNELTFFKGFICDLNCIIHDLIKIQLKLDFSNWLNVCNRLKELLFDNDFPEICSSIQKIMTNEKRNFCIVTDVGNNEYWVSRAYAHSLINKRIIYSKSFGSLGCGLGKAIGAYYAIKSPILLFVGDQGLQFNIQELQTIYSKKLPINIIILNNNSSGMIKFREKAKFNKLIHTDKDSGYSCPDFEKITNAFGIEFEKYRGCDFVMSESKPKILEINISEELNIEPYLPFGIPCQNLFPELPKEQSKILNEL